MTRKLRSQESGMVSIIVTLIMMMVITLIVIGFSQVTRRGQREALDSQLGSQAYYAAETGVNDAVSYINGQLKTGATVTDINTCANSGPLPVPHYLKSGGDTSVAYTCLMVNSSPGDLKVQSVGTTSSKQEHLLDSAGFKDFSFAWKTGGNAPTTTCGSTLGNYPPLTGSTAPWNCAHGLLRVDILQATGSYDAATLANHTVTLYLQPASSNTPVTINSFTTTQRAYQGSCTPDTSTGDCTVKVNLKGSAASKEYYVRLTMIYQPSDLVTISGTEAAGGPATFTDGQYVIDATGRAQDQIKRIQVRVPVNSNSDSLPAYGVQSTDTICKDISVTSSDVTNGTCTASSFWPPGTTIATTTGNDLGDIDTQTGDLSAPGTCSGSCIYWDRTFTITKAPTTSTVNSCTWNWGDGTSQTVSAASCTVGTTIRYVYPQIATCTFYTATLVFHTTSGDVQSLTPQTFKQPHGSDAGC